jgi:type I restriction enzyme S subunit
VSDLPQGWASTTLGAIGDYFNGRGFKKAEWRDTGRPIVRIQNLTGTNLTFNYFQGEPEEDYVARKGDILVSWAATLGVFVWGGPESVVNQHIFKVQSHIDKSFHRYLLQSVLSDLMRQTHGSGMVHITKSHFENTRVLLPPTAEQERIVAAIEEQFSRLDAGSALLDRTQARLSALAKGILLAAVPPVTPSNWESSTIGAVGEVSLGRQRSPKNHSGPNMRPYLRVANVFEDRIDASDVMSMQFTDDEFARFRLRDGDVLLNEGQSPHLLGRPAIYRGDPPEVAFTNSLLRFRAGPSVIPEWALLVFRRHLHAKRFMRESQITTNIAHLSAGRFKSVEFPVPPLEEQKRLVREIQERLTTIRAVEAIIRSQVSRALTLRASILAAAFAGRLAPQDPNDEPASILLKRIVAKRASTDGRSLVKARRQRATKVTA